MDYPEVPSESEAISEQWKAIELIEECFSLELQIMRKKQNKNALSYKQKQ